MGNLLGVFLMALSALVLLNFLLTLAIIRRLSEKTQKDSIELSMLEVGQDAPSFSAETIDGKIVKDSDFNSRFSVRIFVSPGCSPCRNRMPEIEETYYIAKKAGIEIITISLSSIEETKRFIEETKFEPPLLSISPSSSEIISNHKISATPSYYFITENKITQRGSLDGTWDAMVQSWKNYSIENGI